MYYVYIGNDRCVVLPVANQNRENTMIESTEIFTGQLYNELRTWFSEDALIESSLFITLRFTFNPKPFGKNYPPDSLYLNDTSLRKNYDYFWDSLNYTLFGKKYKRSKTKTDKHQLRHLSVLHEHAIQIHSHIHSIISAPVFLSKDDLGEVIKSKWSNTFFGKVDSDWAINVRDIYSHGILEYPFRDKKYFIPQVLSAYIGPDIASASISF